MPIICIAEQYDRRAQGQTGLLFSSPFCQWDAASPLKALSPNQFYKEHVHPDLDHCVQKALKAASLVGLFPKTTTVAKGP